MKKQKGKIKMARDIEVINHHLTLDAEKEKTSNRYDNRYDNRGMQDNSHNSSQSVGLSKGQSGRGPPDAKKNQGRRIWPWSCRDLPKQLLKLTGAPMASL